MVELSKASPHEMVSLWLSKSSVPGFESSKFVKVEDTMFFDLLYDLLDKTTFVNDSVSPPDLAGSTPGTAILSP